MKIFMIIVDKCPNTLTGQMGWRTFLVGAQHPIATKGEVILMDITEGVGKNGKPVVTLIFEKDIIIEIPDYAIEKYRDYGTEQKHTETDNKTRKGKRLDTL